MIVKIKDMEIHIEEDMSHGFIKIYGVKRHGERVVVIGYDGEKLLEQVAPLEPTVWEFKPLLTVPWFYWKSMSEGLAQQLSKRGLATENENLLKGKLEATQAHLTDMRDMSKQMLTKILKDG
jgi:hypothetical protein